MSLEQAILDLTAAVNANTKALGGFPNASHSPQQPDSAPSAATTETKPKRGRPAAEKPAETAAAAAESAIPMKTVAESIMKLATDVSADAARKILAAHGAAKVSQLKPETYAAVLADIKAAYPSETMDKAVNAGSLI